MFQKDQLCYKIFRPWRHVGFVRQCRMVGCFSVCLLLLVLPCVAQSTTGDIIASVADPSSAMVPDASLVLTQLETGQQTVLKTDANGLAVFSSLRPGNYKLVASRDGFRRAELNGITVVIGQRTNLEVHMQVGDNTESVTVSASQAAMLNSESAAVGQVINQNSIQTLPLNGRNFVQLTQLTTGAAPIGNGNSPATTWT
ncbi:carboxypeptidase-like regulatory domain-containing protein, partial [Terriglobus sp. YAF25]